MNFETTEGLPKYFREIKKSGGVGKDREKELAVEIANGSQAAVRELAEGNLLLVVRIANRHKGQGVPLEDLIQEGNIGLLEAARNFRPNHERGFVPYASLWIRKYMNEAVAKTGRIVRLPHNQEYEIYKAKMRGEEPDVPTRVSLDKPIGEEKDSTLADVILNAAPEIEMEIELEQIRFQVGVAVSSLKDRDREIVFDYFGINREYSLNTKEIAEKHSMTNVRVSQIVKASLEKMKELLC
jgi:RNA polymerase primary sigma factor